MRRIECSTQRGFTEVEFLVVIGIIVLFFAFIILSSTPGGGAMDKAKELKDLSNIGQCGIAFLNYANDHDGAFPTTNTTATDLFNALTNGGYLTEPKIVAGSGAHYLTDSGPLMSSNVAWSCAKGLTTSDNPDYALLWSKGTILSVTTNGKLVIDASGNYWGKKGKSFAAVFYINGSAANPNFPQGSLIATNPLNSTNGLSANVYTNYLNP